MMATGFPVRGARPGRRDPQSIAVVSAPRIPSLYSGFLSSSAVGRGTIERGKRHVAEPQVHRELAAVMNHVAQDEAAQDRGAWSGVPRFLRVQVASIAASDREANAARTSRTS
jgi:hypothetical protein